MYFALVERGTLTINFAKGFSIKPVNIFTDGIKFMNSCVWSMDDSVVKNYHFKIFQSLYSAV